MSPQVIFRDCKSKMEAPVSYKQRCTSVLTIIIESIYIDTVKQLNNYCFTDLQLQSRSVYSPEPVMKTLTTVWDPRAFFFYIYRERYELKEAGQVNREIYKQIP